MCGVRFGEFLNRLWVGPCDIVSRLYKAVLEKLVRLHSNLISLGSEAGWGWVFKYLSTRIYSVVHANFCGHHYLAIYTDLE